MLEALVLEGHPSDMVYVPPVLSIGDYSTPEVPRNHNQNDSYQGKTPQGNAHHQVRALSGSDGGQFMPPRPPAGFTPDSQSGLLSPQGGNGLTSTQPQTHQDRGNSTTISDSQKGQQGRGRGREVHHKQHHHQHQQQNGEKQVSNGSVDRVEMGRGSGRGQR